ncbi:MAG: adenylate/guanylate cyclase domain-containing protein [Alphaproteobacteria bacterium]|nr:adenylate/guanylate cyclase domain-containing protein [Alphaproteobacteria bacterium]
MVEALAATDEPFGSVRRENVAVLFADIVDFTELSEQHPPERVIALLREFHGRMAQVVLAHGGTLHKFLGDRLMATSGTPQAAADDPARALECARAMQAAIEEWNGTRAANGWRPVRVGIGLHFGPVVLGEVGDDNRIEYAVVGDTVNVASRLERLTRELDVPIVISDDLVRRVREVRGGADINGLTPAAATAPRGRTAETAIWTLPAAA